MIRAQSREAMLSLSVQLSPVPHSAAHRQWREEQRQYLAEKDAEETTSLDELRRTAQKELQDWYNHYEEQLGHTKSSNRSVSFSHPCLLLYPQLFLPRYSTGKQKRCLLRRETRRTQASNGKGLLGYATSTPRTIRIRRMLVGCAVSSYS